MGFPLSLQVQVSPIQSTRLCQYLKFEIKLEFNLRSLSEITAKLTNNFIVIGQQPSEFWHFEGNGRERDE